LRREALAAQDGRDSAATDRKTEYGWTSFLVPEFRAMQHTLTVR
jgi:hypothetical protein